LRRGEYAGLAWAGVSSILFGTALTVAGAIFEFLTPIEVIAVRMVGGGLICLPFAIPNRFRFGSDLKYIVLIGSGMALLNLAVYSAIQRIGVGPAAGIQFLGPAFVVVWKRFRHRTRYGPVMWVAVAAGIAGAALLAKAWVVEAFDPVGILLALASGLGLATYLVIAEDLNRRHGPVAVTMSAMVIGGLTMSAFFPLDLIARVPSNGWWLLGWIATMGMVVPFLLEVTALRSAPAEKVGLVITLEPFSAAVSAWLYLNESLHGLQVAGMVLVVAAVIASGRLKPLVAFGSTSTSTATSTKS
jgi:inner membrane transporter RhtA